MSLDVTFHSILNIYVIIKHTVAVPIKPWPGFPLKCIGRSK